MRVVFLENVPQVAHAGDVKEVADGYGRNFLLPRKLAKPASAVVMRELKEQHDAVDRRTAKLESEAENLAKKLEGVAVTIKAKVGAQGRLYGSVTNANVAEQLSKAVGQTIDRRRVMLHDPIRALGTFPVEVHLPNAHTATVQVTVAGTDA